MRRSGALALGAILILGGVSGGRGDELSDASGSTPTGPNSQSSNDFALPTLPENWSDLPVRLTASQSAQYNSNIFGAFNGFVLPPGTAHGDFVSTTQFGISTNPFLVWSDQEFFFNASFGEIRYLHQVDFNTDIYTVNTGVNWTYASRCSGVLSAFASKSPTTVTTQVRTVQTSNVQNPILQNLFGANYLTTAALNETGNCAFGNGYSAIFNSSESQFRNSNVVDALNNSRSTMVAAGIEYKNSLSDLTALATITDTNFSNRNSREAALVGLTGLASTFVQHDVSLSYVRTIDTNLTLAGQIGLTGAGTEFTLGLPRTLLPHYSATIGWTITPKLNLTATAAKTINAPTTLVSNAQLAYLAAFKLSYQVTPKIVIGAGASVSYVSAVFTPSTLPGTAGRLSGAEDLYSAQASLTYTMTPFLVAALTASYNETVQSNPNNAGLPQHLVTPETLITASLNYKPY
jgi:hypothetical protein